MMKMPLGIETEMLIASAIASALTKDDLIESKSRRMRRRQHRKVRNKKNKIAKQSRARNRR